MSMMKRKAYETTMLSGLSEGGWRIRYTKDGSSDVAFLVERTLLGAVAVFNTLDRTSGFDTDLTIERVGTYGDVTNTWVMAGRYGVPMEVTS
jgi:hypothetical protein